MRVFLLLASVVATTCHAAVIDDQRPRGGRIDTDVSPMHALADLISSGAGDVPGKLLGSAAKKMLKTEAKARMGRFLDGLFGGDGDGSGYTAPVASLPNPVGDIIQRIFPFNIDTDEVMRGFLKPENVAVHVAQNTVNYVSSSLAWLLLSMLTSQTEIAGRDVDGSAYHAPTPSYQSPATSYSLANEHFAASEANEVKAALTSSNSREQQNQLMADSVSAELEAAAKLDQQERLYELQVQEYRRRKKAEAIKRKKMMMEAAASEQKAAKFVPSAAFEGGEEAAPPSQLNKRLSKVETYQKYLKKQQLQQQLAQQQQQQLAQQQPLLQRRASDNIEEPQPSLMTDVHVKSKGSGGPMRRLRKIKKQQLN